VRFLQNAGGSVRQRSRASCSGSAVDEVYRARAARNAGARATWAGPAIFKFLSIDER